MDEKSSKPRKPNDAEASTNEKAPPKPRVDKPADGKIGLASLESLMQRREVRIGMAVLAMLVLVLGYLFVSKINEVDTSQARETETDQPSETDAPLTERPPTIVTASAVNESVPTAPPSAGTDDDVPNDVSDSPRHEHAPPNSSYLPRRMPADHVADATPSDNGQAHADAPPGVVANDTSSRYGVDRDAGTEAAAPGKYGRGNPAFEPMDVEAPSRTATDPGVVAHANDEHGTPNDGSTGNGAETPATDSGGIASEPQHRGNETVAVPSSDIPMTDPRSIAQADSHVATPGTIAADRSVARDGVPPGNVADARPVEAKPTEQVADTNPRETQTIEHQPRVGTDDAVKPAAESPRNRTYVTVEGDSPASIAKAHYDDSRLAAALMAYNGVEIASETQLTPGGEVLIPQADLLRKEFANLIPAALPPRATAGGEPPASESANAIDRGHHEIAANETPVTKQGSQHAPARTIPQDHPQHAVPAQAGDQSDSREVATSTKTYEVRRGETVYDIARRELGRVSRWREILELNQEQLGGDIDAIEPGMKLVLPEEGRSNVARQRGELLWR